MEGWREGGREGGMEGGGEWTCLGKLRTCTCAYMTFFLMTFSRTVCEYPVPSEGSVIQSSKVVQHSHMEPFPHTQGDKCTDVAGFSSVANTCRQHSRYTQHGKSKSTSELLLCPFWYPVTVAGQIRDRYPLLSMGYIEGEPPPSLSPTWEERKRLLSTHVHVD